ncbi:MAG: 30S ribosomal protein S18, partial [Actinobacteria bacterium]|nr:30S ribosomal protein S18 [Actinomycetota bacterium]
FRTERPKTSKKNKARAPREANPKKFKKKTSVLVTEKGEVVDYKDVNLLQRFVSDRSKIRNRRVTGNDVQQQRDIANAIKNAREMALIPYTKRVSQTRTGRGPREGREGRDGDERRPRRDEAAAAAPAEVDTAIETTETDGVEVEA